MKRLRSSRRYIVIFVIPSMKFPAETIFQNWPGKKNFAGSRNRKSSRTKRNTTDKYSKI